jgi:hypothetical protein
MLPLNVSLMLEHLQKEFGKKVLQHSVVEKKTLLC